MKDEQKIALKMRAKFLSGLIIKKSGLRESDPPPQLGKLMHYRCAKAAFASAKLQRNSHIHKFFLLFLLKITFYPV